MQAGGSLQRRRKSRSTAPCAGRAEHCSGHRGEARRHRDGRNTVTRKLGHRDYAPVKPHVSAHLKADAGTVRRIDNKGHAPRPSSRLPRHENWRLLEACWLLRQLLPHLRPRQAARPQQKHGASRATGTWHTHGTLLGPAHRVPMGDACTDGNGRAQPGDTVASTSRGRLQRGGCVQRRRPFKPGRTGACPAATARTNAGDTDNIVATPRRRQHRRAPGRCDAGGGATHDIAGRG